MSKSIFREQALAAAEDIKHLPQSMRVTSSLTRWVLSGLALSLGLCLVWSALVHVPVQVRGQGILIDRTGELLVPVRIEKSGYIEDLAVSIGDNVKKGQVIAKLNLPSLSLDLQKSQQRLKKLRDRLIDIDRLEAEEKSSQTAERRKQRAAAETQISDLNRQVSWLTKHEADLKKLLAKGDTTATRVEEVSQQLATARENAAAARAHLQSLQTSKISSYGSRQRERFQIKDSISQTKIDIAAQQKSLVELSVLRSPANATVSQISVDPGALVSGGQVAVSLLRDDVDNAKPLEALVFVAMRNGKRIEAGDDVLIEPGSLPLGAHDRLRAKVTKVSDTVMTQAAIKRALGNAQLAQQVASGGAPFALRISLQQDTKTPSGYAWTSSEGPKIRLTPGTPLNASIVVERRPLLVLALPALKKMLGAQDNAWTANPS